MQSLPRELSLDDEGRLVSRPIDEIQRLRKEPHKVPEMDLPPGIKHTLPVAGRHLSLALTLETLESGLVLDLLACPDSGEKVCLRLTPGGKRLEMDLSESSLADGLQKPCLGIELPYHPSGSLMLQVFIDGSVIEAWVDDRIALTGRAFPKAENADRMVISSIEGRGMLRDLRIWKMEAIWPTLDER